MSAAATKSKCMVIISPMEVIERMASVSAVVIFSRSTCCMCLAAKSLFCALGVSPMVYEIDRQGGGKDLEWALSSMLLAGKPPVPAVFVGGKLVGAMDSVLGSHINGELVPRLKDAGALWL